MVALGSGPVFCGLFCCCFLFLCGYRYAYLPGGCALLSYAWLLVLFLSIATLTVQALVLRLSVSSYLLLVSHTGPSL